MKLYVNGQDISHITVGDIERDELITVETETEGFLQVINTFVRKRIDSYDQLQAIFAVTGPGSATALRSVLSILQTIHFVEGTQLFALEKDPSEDDVKAMSRATSDAQSVETLIPIYQHSPRITISKKDALGR
jgi:hypothetical protein